MPTNTPEKDYRITFEQRPDYLYALVEAEQDSYEISLAYWREIADECKVRNITKVMVEEDMQGTATMVEAYQVAAELPKMGFLGIKLAFVDTHLDQSDLNAFGELVAVNRGVNGKFFNDQAVAEAWLIS